MAKALTKKELKEPDAFVVWASKAGHLLEQNIKLVLSLVGVVLIGFMGWLGFQAYQNSQESSAAEALYAIEAKTITTLNTAKANEIPSLTEYVSTLKSHGHTKVALVSAVTVVGKLQGIEGSEIQQKDILSTITYVPSKSNILYGLSRLTYGQVALSNNELSEAQSYFKAVVDEPSQKPLHGSALIQLGGVAEKNGDFAGARSFYQRVIQELPDSEAKRMAEKLIIHLDLLSEGGAQGS